MSIQIVLVQLLLTCALAQTCALQLCFHALAQIAGILQVHLTSRFNTSLARGSEVQIGSSFPFSTPTMISGVVGWHQGHVSCCPYACLEDTPFKM